MTTNSERSRIRIHSILSPISWLYQVITSAAYRFYWDDCFSRASALAYTTLFALVPVTALSLSMFSVFGLQSEEGKFALRTILEQLLPPMENDTLRQLQEVVLTNLEMFTSNVQALNTVSIAVLVFTSIALLNTIESALNVIWRTTSNLSLVAKLTSFWTVLTLGPLLIALSIYWTTRMRNLGWADESSDLRFILFSYLLPIGVTVLALAILFYKLPASRVRPRDALLGAFIAATLFEFIKRGFAYYVGLSTTYSTIYGVVAAVPLFLFWLYVAWVVVLLGAEISYQAGAIHILTGLQRYMTQLGDIGATLGLRVLLCIGRRFSRGETPPSEGDIAIETGSDPVLVRNCLNILSTAGILSALDEKTHGRSLLLSPDTITVSQVLETFRSKKGIRGEAKEVESRAFLSLIQRTGGGGKDITEFTLSELLEREDPLYKDS